MFDILTYIENILRVLTTIFTISENNEGFNIDFKKDEHIFILSIMIGFTFGLIYSYMKN